MFSAARNAINERIARAGARWEEPMRPKKIGFDKAVEVIKIGREGTDWVCKHCGRKNLLVVGNNDITSCANCKGLVMIKWR